MRPELLSWELKIQVVLLGYDPMIEGLAYARMGPLRPTLPAFALPRSRAWLPLVHDSTGVRGKPPSGHLAFTRILLFTVAEQGRFGHLGAGASGQEL